MRSSISALYAAVVLVASLVSVNAQQPAWAQCGGNGWTGGTTCVAGWTCVYSNYWYSQCLQVSSTPVKPSSTSTSTRPTVIDPDQTIPPPRSTSTSTHPTVIDPDMSIPLPRSTSTSTRRTVLDPDMTVPPPRSTSTTTTTTTTTTTPTATPTIIKTFTFFDSYDMPATHSSTPITPPVPTGTNAAAE